MDKFKQQASMFKALSDENRLYILNILKSSEKCATDIMNIISIPQPALSYHMKILCNAGLVDFRKHGKKTYYQLNINKCYDIVELLNTLVSNVLYNDLL